MFQLAVASGKGGAGKTTVSTSLAKALAGRRAVQYLDCDVEAPNGHLFLKPEFRQSIPVTRWVPRIDHRLCEHCGKCSEFCQYSALVSMPRQTIVYPEMCRGCGGCKDICPAGAISEVERQVGTVQLGMAGSISFVHGELRVREIATVPMVRAVRRQANGAELVILDAPPGTSCPMVASVRGVDAVLLVTDPTPFALHDLKLTVEVIRELELRAGVVLNRAALADAKVEEYCDLAELPIWGRIPDDRRIAEAYSEGEMPYEAVPAMRDSVDALAETIEREVMA